MAKQTRKLKIDQWDFQLELTFIVDNELFTEEFAKDLNEFLGGSKTRLRQSGSHVDAALKLYAAECFRLAAFNNFLDAEWVTAQFDWSKDNGVEGFETFEVAGLTLTSIDNAQFTFDLIKFDE